jgi:CheY-like chemotaxis protein
MSIKETLKEEILLNEKEAGVNAKRLRILVVEDDVTIATSLGDLLELWGYEVRVVHDGLEATEVASSYQPEVVLLDIDLPGMDGYQIARWFQQDIQLAKTVRIAVTGYGQEEDRRRAQEAGFDYHFTKPVAPVILQELLARLQKCREKG